MALVLAALAAAGSGVAPKALPKYSLLTSTAGDFTIHGTVYPWPSCAGASPASLAPGRSDCLLLSVTDNLQVAISVTQITAQITSAVYADSGAAPSHCVTYLSPKFTAAPLSSPSYPYPYSYTWTGLTLHPSGHNQSDQVAEPFSFTDLPASNQSDCEGVKYTFNYTGAGTYTEVYGTSTALGSSLNPSAFGQPVTYTATVTASATASQDPVPSSPTGTVTFKDNGATICNAVAVTSASTTTATASCVAPANMSVGTHPITAAYSNSDGNFSGSTSSTLNQVVNRATTSTAVTTSPNPSNYGQSVTLNATVTPSSGPAPAGSVSFYLGAPTANHTLIGSGTLNASGKATVSTTTLPGGSDSLYAVYAGSTSDSGSTSPVVSQTVNFSSTISGKSNGNVTVASGQDVAITSTGSVTGNITVSTGGRLDILGGSVGGNVTVASGGGINVQTGTIGGSLNATSPNYFTVCGAKVSGNLSATGSTAFALVGDGGDDGSPACAGNTISGNLTLTNSTAGAEIGGNTVSGGISLTGTTGTGPSTENSVPEVEKNTVGSGLACSSNTPAPTSDGLPNKVSGKSSGQCVAGF